MHCLIAPDSFKGSLSAHAVAEAIATGLRRVRPTLTLDLCPMADGGEGTLAALHSSVGGTLHACQLRNAEGEPCQAHWLQLPDGLAVCEVAQAVGLPAVGRRPLAERDSYGVGQLLLAMLDAGAHRIAVGLGGSGSNDGGAGMLAALGGVWRDGDGQPLPPHPWHWPAQVCFDTSALDARLARVSLQAWSDVRNPLCGAQGASAVFGPQKGMLADQLPRFDAALAQLAQALLAQRPGVAPDVAGGGAAGGIGFALQWLGAVPCSGAQAVADACRLVERIARADWVLTGEGRSDSQTLSGKAPAEVARLARAAGVPVTLLSGAVADDAMLSARFDGCFSLCPGPVTLAQAMADAVPWLAQAAEQLLRLHLAVRRGLP